MDGIHIGKVGLYVPLYEVRMARPVHWESLVECTGGESMPVMPVHTFIFVFTT